jgi:hypothetical protein
VVDAFFMIRRPETRNASQFHLFPLEIIPLGQIPPQVFDERRDHPFESDQLIHSGIMPVERPILILQMVPERRIFLLGTLDVCGVVTTEDGEILTLNRGPNVICRDVRNDNPRFEGQFHQFLRTTNIRANAQLSMIAMGMLGFALRLFPSTLREIFF